MSDVQLYLQQPLYVPPSWPKHERWPLLRGERLKSWRVSSRGLVVFKTTAGRKILGTPVVTAMDCSDGP